MRELSLALDSRRKTRKLGAALARLLEPGDVLWLEGELGAGKTFLTRGLLRALGIPHTVPVTSPTFTLVREYEARLKVYHLDLYRLSDPDELRELGIEEWLDEAVLVIEWGARFRKDLSDRGLEIALSVPSTERGRLAHLTARDPRGEELLSGVADDPALG